MTAVVFEVIEYEIRNTFRLLDRASTASDKIHRLLF